MHTCLTKVSQWVIGRSWECRRTHLALLLVHKLQCRCVAVALTVTTCQTGGDSECNGNTRACLNVFDEMYEIIVGCTILNKYDIKQAHALDYNFTNIYT